MRNTLSRRQLQALVVLRVRLNALSQLPRNEAQDKVHVLDSHLAAIQPHSLIGANGIFRGTVRYKVAALVALLLQSTVAITLSALIITYTGYMTSHNRGYIFAWLVGTIAAIYPMWQTRSRAKIERLSEPDAYVTKEATHAAIPYALVVTVGFTLLFVFRPVILDTLFYWLLVLSGLIYLCSIVSIVIIARRQY